ncbi:hypothetical protein MtrunA17_Chr7g0228931 [Medicago truncatula]|uniref:Transmembrane protein n=1 Tax=Medicago truncatula TaxID=3880 RepID=A0A396H0S5_MEDTR|nr:hypothetical protein MtrunA17_Chr7g0228931 [Medicago truncatula]
MNLLMLILIFKDIFVEAKCQRFIGSCLTLKNISAAMTVMI